MLTDKEAAALERLEAEKERRISEKIERGEAIRAPLVIVGALESADAAYNRAVARLRAAGEKREVVFPKYEMRKDGELGEAINVIITGVPRAGRDDNYTPPNVSEPPAPSICDRRSAGGDAFRQSLRDVTERTPAIADKQIETPRAENPPSGG
jgi:hypothetical protein